MAGVEHRDFSTPDETRTPDKTTVELVNLAGGQIGLHLPAGLEMVRVHQASRRHRQLPSRTHRLLPFGPDPCHA